MRAGPRLRPGRVPLGPGGPRRAVAGQGPLDGLKQVAVLHRLREEIDRPGLHGLHARRDIPVAADEDDRNGIASALQGVLQLEPGHLRHPKVEHQTARPLVPLPGKELAGRGERLDSVPGRTEHPHERLSDARVVVNQEDQRGVPVVSAAVEPAGRRIRKIAPPSGSFSAQIRPPYVSTIERLMDSPTPSPSPFVL